MRPRLYREQFATFEDYCRERWGMSRVHAHRLIESAEVIGNLLPIGNTVPANEAQARALTGLEPEQQRTAWLVRHGAHSLFAAARMIVVGKLPATPRC